ncbi:MAG: dTDP-4-dehydrorhamnose 3,5-epimerase [Chromatiaceae bacterium]|nr:MAG: dTDP-4-dehydrorhamnose 3,5-epimerase [Chromatiaceae bacterium]
MKITPTGLPEVLLIEPRVFGDERGFFIETWQQQRYAEAGVGREFVQDNMAYSRRGALRGLHIQHPHAQGKLVQALVGEVFDVAVDARFGSPRFGHWVGVRLTADGRQQLWVPEGFLHGYLVTSAEALISYKCTDLYHPETQFSVRWDDPDIGINWPAGVPPILAEKDRDAPLLREIDRTALPEMP